MKKNIVILGSTGVLGSKIIKFLEPSDNIISLITCYSNQSKLLKIKKKIKPKFSVVLDPLIKNKFDFLNYGDSYVINYIKNNKIDFFYLLDSGFDSLNFLNILIKNQKNLYFMKEAYLYLLTGIAIGLLFYLAGKYVF